MSGRNHGRARTYAQKVIPVVCRMISIRTGGVGPGTTYPCRWTRPQVTGLFTQVNTVWSQAQLRFNLVGVYDREINGWSGDTVNESMYGILSAQLSAEAPGSGVSLGVVNAFQHLRSGGHIRGDRACVIQLPLSGVLYAAPGLVLAHELGHLLELDDDPSQETVMFHAQPQSTHLNQDQIDQARRSALGR